MVGDSLGLRRKADMFPRRQDNRLRRSGVSARPVALSRRFRRFIKGANAPSRVTFVSFTFKQAIASLLAKSMRSSSFTFVSATDRSVIFRFAKMLSP